MYAESGAPGGLGRANPPDSANYRQIPFCSRERPFRATPITAGCHQAEPAQVGVECAGMLTRPRVLLHVEGAVVLVGAGLLYWGLEGNWLLFVVLLLAPDIGMLGFLRNTRVGAATYNLFHTYSVPLGLGAGAWLWGLPWLVLLAVIWVAHIGMDRAAGFGLKYPTHFKDTHLGRL